MIRTSTPVFPAWTIVLDVAGALFVAGGIFLLVSDRELMELQATDLRGPAIAMIVIGVTLMVPLIVAVVKRAAASR